MVRDPVPRDPPYVAPYSLRPAVTDASKAALAYLIDYLKARGYALLDVQWTNAHTRSLGATDISRTEYVARLARAIEKKVAFF